MDDVSELISAVGKPFPATSLRDSAAFVTERRARQAQIAALRASLRMQSEAARSLDPNVGQRIDRAF
jgi:hypothetical protein